ncbi:hypothetical protein Pryu01_02256 [Paraliobacillus ryukyuensis]|uniref:Putative membrane protein n=2 Tax=Paraliobacillus ryukyuensis TaxID=200904 RepID=A0A366E6Q7_9BACI|nr:putative membrane protein [Paraliobacillus ryukyuensis]
MMRWIVSLLLNAVALIVVSYLFDSFYLAGIWTALLASLILSILNAVVKPILVVLTLPVTILSLGLFLFVINAITLMLSQAVIGNAFVIDGFGIAILSAIVLSFINLILIRLIKDRLD